MNSLCLISRPAECGYESGRALPTSNGEPRRLRELEFTILGVTTTIALLRGLGSIGSAGLGSLILSRRVKLGGQRVKPFCEFVLRFPIVFRFFRHRTHNANTGKPLMLDAGLTAASLAESPWPKPGLLLRCDAHALAVEFLGRGATVLVEPGERPVDKSWDRSGGGSAFGWLRGHCLCSSMRREMVVSPNSVARTISGHT